MVTLEHLQSLLEKGEGEELEFKEGFGKEAIIAAAALANSNGGYLLIGVSDQAQVTGVQIHKETLREWLSQINMTVAPQLGPQIQEIEFQSKKIVVFTISENPVKPVSYKGRYYKRVGSANMQMEPFEIATMHFHTRNASWDYTAALEYTLEDVDLAKVYRLIEKMNRFRAYPMQEDSLEILNKFELLRGQQISYGCHLMFMKRQESLMTNIDIGRFADLITIKDSVTVSGDILSQPEQVLAAICKHLNKEYIITGKQLEREERWDYPLAALREIIMNMIVHRNYHDSSDSKIKIFNDRIEFVNPGGIFAGQTTEMFVTGKYVSRIRNKQVSRLFKELEMIEAYGSGISRVIQMCVDYGLPGPSVEVFPDYFRWVVYGAAPQKTPQIINQDPVISTKSQIKEILKSYPEVTRQDLVKQLGRHEDTIKQHLLELKNAGEIERVGSDRAGYWRVIK
ncbi:MAG: putative DNA binding domain-containing protein [Gammaproteobacteria bacterium]|nr:putative DNA binding domain-containing protein [Gammaproteobacteria bacterium]